MTTYIDIGLNKAMTNHNDPLIKEATQLTQIGNLLDKTPDTNIPIRPPDTDIPIRPPDTDIPNRPINILSSITHLTQADPQTIIYQTDPLT